MTKLVRAFRNAHHAVCTLDLPEKRNPISKAMRQALIETLESLRADPSVRSVIITGEGSAFCSGLDLDEFAALQSLSAEQHRADSQSICDFLCYLAAYPKPTIAALNGPAIAGGCAVALLCDFALAVPSAYLCFSEVKIGFVPAIAGVFLQQMLGPKRTRDLLLTGRKVMADEAKEFGLLNSVVESAQLLPKSQELAEQLALNSPQALESTKALLSAVTGSLSSALALAVDVNASARTSSDCVEGVKAFLEKRAPDWRT
ncbi:MAG TPA: enoyl-CoA hydratase/isomerase family protein [Planctomycetota bacterium]|jgi:methylglutaconyl-CoA hydratase